MVEVFQVKVTPFNHERSIRVYLPYGYFEEQLYYPVLYMHDGQTLFQDEDVANGTSHRLREYLDHERMQVIVVGIDSNTEGYERVNEYSPWANIEFSKEYLKGDGIMGGRAEEYIDFIVSELKPLIDTRYRTLKEETYMAGCSMGGLCTTYAACRYPNIFMKVAALSSSYWFNRPEIEELIRTSDLTGIKSFYLDCGTNEGPDEESRLNFVETHRKVHGLLKPKITNSTFMIIEDAPHTLEAFRERMPSVLASMGIKKHS